MKIWLNQLLGDVKRAMKEVYSVLFTKKNNGTYLVEIPDLDCITEGKNLNDAIDMARDAMGLKGITLEDMGKKIPKPTKNIKIENGTFYTKGKTISSYVDIDFDDYRKSIDNKIIRRNVSIPNWMDRACEKEHLNVSKILQDALSHILNKKYSPV